MHRFFTSCILSLSIIVGLAQPVKPRPLTMAEYQKAKTYRLKDLDNDSYAKFDNSYMLDRYEMRKPYYITGDDSLKKRIDLYKLMAKDGMQELGTLVFYTNEKGTLYTVLQPNFTADKEVWNSYFNDIDSINKLEKNFVLKLSYVLSREMSFQLYKAMNNGRDLKDEAGTYGTDICFPGDQEVAMADGTKKIIRNIHEGDLIVTVHPVTKKAVATPVIKVEEHLAKNYAITRLLLVTAEEHVIEKAIVVHLDAKLLSATPNHPVLSAGVRKRIGDLIIGEQMLCYDSHSSSYKNYTLFNKSEAAGGLQKVYNLNVASGTTVILNDVIVLQK